jgi:iron complex outermembrane receptor protein
MKIQKLCSVSSVVLAAFFATGAQAQVSNSVDAAATAVDSPDTDIVVTARKKTERAIDVPVAITTFSREQMERYSSNNLELISQATPGLVIGATGSGSGSALNLRGIGGSETTFTVEQAVSLNLDGVQVAQGGASRLGLFDLEAIEVLKGPQVLFFGKNSSAGVLSLVSADPTPTFQGRLRGSYEIYNNAKTAEAMLSGPLGSGFGGRIAVRASQQTGWFKNVIQPTAATGQVPDKGYGPDEREISGRATVTYVSPDSGFTAKLKVSASHQAQNNGYETLVQYIGCTFGRPAPTRTIVGASTDCVVDRNFVAAKANAEAAALDPLFNKRGGNPYTTSDLYIGSLSMHLPLTDHLSLDSITGYYHAREGRFATFPFSEQATILRAMRNGYEQASQEFRLQSSFTGPVNFLGGVYFEMNTLDLFRQPIALGPPVFAAYAITTDQFWKQKGRAGSVFGQVTVKPATNLEIAAGARWSAETKSFAGGQLAGPAAGRGLLRFPIERRTFHNLSPEVTISYHPVRDVNIYATYRKGFKSGGFNLAGSTVANTDVSFAPEKADGGEIGVKGRFADGQLRVDVSAYRYNYSDLQVSAFNPETLSTAILNAANARVQGVESTLAVSPLALPGFQFRAALAYNDSHYTNYIGPCYPGQSIADGCNLIKVGTAFTGQDLAGMQFVRAPKWSGNVGATYRHALNDGLSLELSSDATHSGSIYTDRTYAPASFQKAIWRWDASVALSGSDDRWKLALVGRNLTNRLAVVNSNAAPFTGSGTGTANAVLADQVGSVSAPRTVEMSLTLKF